ncbi:MAG: NAD-dependent epimerase/dehydratase family protein [Clostridiales bacterium]|nr:NAD-dependent epimerase/dehydratase family protein [Clostridiales bacterium]
MAEKYLVTGGAGPLGKLIVSMLLEQGKDVRILMSELADVSEYKEKNIEISYGISTDKDTLKEFFDVEDPRHSVLIHADEYISLSDKTNLNMRRVNVAGTENIIDMCIKRKIGRIVYLGSAYALNPDVQGEEMTIHFDRNKVEGEYAKTKAEAAAFIMEKVTLNRLNAVLVLPTFIIGPGYAEDHDINKILRAYLKNGVNPIKEGGGHAFVDVRDVATAMIALVDKGEAGSGYIVSGAYKTSEEFFQDINEIKGIEQPVKMTPKWVMKKSLSKFVDTYYKITHKENPKNVYALFQDNPQIMYANRNDIIPETVISFKETIAETMGEEVVPSAAPAPAADAASDTSADPASDPNQ